MIISEIQSEIGHCSCDGAKFKAPPDFSHRAILFFTLSLNIQESYRLHTNYTKLSTVGVVDVIMS